jgi:hypothetical protein
MEVFGKCVRSARAAVPGRRTAGLLAAVSVALVASVLAVPAATAKSSPVAGELDADVLHARSGKPIGTVHGSIDGRRGFAVFIPRGSGTASARLWLHAERVKTKGGTTARPAQQSQLWRLTGAEGDSQVRIFQRANSERITGRGVAPDGTRVRIRGYGGVPRPNVGKGVLLQVGTRLGGEIKDALRRNYRLRRVSPRAHRRSRLLTHPRLLDRVAGVVVARNASLRRLRKSGLLRTLANGHRWVVIARATNARLKTLRGILPVARLPHSSSVPAAAMRLNGVKGLSDAKRTVVVYPGAPPAKVRVRRAGGTVMVPVELTRKVSKRLRRQRETFFARQLRRAGAAYARPTRDRSKRAIAGQSTGGTLNAECTQAGQTPASGSVDSCYQIDVSHLAQMVMPAFGNVGVFCLWSGKGSDNDPLYCPGSSQFDELAGGPPAAGGPYQASAAQFAAVCPQTGKNASYYTAILPTLGSGAVFALAPDGFNGIGELPGNNVYGFNPCPAATPSGGAQVATYTETDSYFAVYEPPSGQQGVIVQVAGSITPNNVGDGGPGVVSSNGGYNYPQSGTSHSLGETGWLLGGAQTQVQYTPPSNLGSAQPFLYAQPPVGNSYPTNQITDTTESSTSTSQSGFQVGVSTNKSSSFQWSSSTSLAVETTVAVPDWTVIPNATTQTNGDSTVDYDWTSTTPISYQQMQCTAPSSGKEPYGGGCGQPMGSGSYNTLNGSTWEPGSQTQWSGDQTGGYPVITTTHNWDFTDHYSAWSGEDAVIFEGKGSLLETPVDAFQNAQFSQSTGSTATTGFGSQEIDLCDPLVTTAASLPPLC